MLPFYETTIPIAKFSEGLKKYSGETALNLNNYAMSIFGDKAKEANILLQMYTDGTEYILINGGKRIRFEPNDTIPN